VCDLYILVSFVIAYCIERLNDFGSHGTASVAVRTVFQSIDCLSDNSAIAQSFACLK